MLASVRLFPLKVFFLYSNLESVRNCTFHRPPLLLLLLLRVGDDDDDKTGNNKESGAMESASIPCTKFLCACGRCRS